MLQGSDMLLGTGSGLVTVGITGQQGFQNRFEKPSKDELNSMMFGLVERLSKLCGELPAFSFDRYSWYFELPPTASGEVVKLRFSMPLDGGYPLAVTRMGQTVLYRFRDDVELNRIVPSDHSSFVERWTMDEIQFAQSLPESNSPSHGKPELQMR